MQQNLDFKYGAGQKKWRVGGYLKKNRIITVKKRCQWEKATYCVMLMIKLNRCIYLFGCGCVPSATKSFFFLQCVKSVSSLFNTCVKTITEIDVHNTSSPCACSKYVTYYQKFKGKNLLRHLFKYGLMFLIIIQCHLCIK